MNLKVNRQYFYFFISIIIIFLFALIIFPIIRVPETKITIELQQIKFNNPIWIYRQIIAFTVFFATITGTLSFWKHRVAIASVGIAILLFTGVMDLDTTVKFMSIPVILFIIAIMIVVAYLEYNGVLKLFIVWVINKVGNNPRNLYIILLLLSVILSGFVGEVSGIAITTLLAIEVSEIFGIDPFPFIIGLVFATNVGSALTLIGNPIGIYIAFAGKLTFIDFVRWASPLSLLSAIIITFFTLFLFRKRIPKKIIETPEETTMRDFLHLFLVLRDKRKFITSVIIFGILIIFIVLHTQIETILKLSPTTVIVSAPILITGIIIFIEKDEGKRFLLEGVDWWTIVFFMFLFAEAACLEYTGITTKLSYVIERWAKNIYIPFLPKEYSITIIAFTLLLWIVGITSGFVDNLPIIAAMVPIVKDLKMLGLPHGNILWWSLLFGGCFGGNLTMIGSTANIVALSIYGEKYKKDIKFKEWFKFGLPVFFVSIILIMFFFLIQIKLSP